MSSNQVSSVRTGLSSFRPCAAPYNGSSANMANFGYGTVAYVAPVSPYNQHQQYSRTWTNVTTDAMNNSSSSSVASTPGHHSPLLFSPVQPLHQSEAAIAKNQALFVDSVLNSRGGFTYSYSLLKGDVYASTGSGGFGFGTPLNCISPVDALYHHVEPLKLGKMGARHEQFLAVKDEERRPLKRARSSTMVEAPEDLDAYEHELYQSRPASPEMRMLRLKPVAISPAKQTRSCAALPVQDHAGASGVKTVRQVKHGLGGERRLNIQFSNTGTLKDGPVQSFGKYKLLIRNGLCGTHTMYAQPWRFEINHVDPGNALGEVRLRWSVTNLQSGNKIVFVETTEQAHERQAKGNTICNLVVREALTKRALELEEDLKALILAGSHSAKIANLKSLIKELRPKQCTEGLLFFGLRHQAAQNRGD